MKRILILGSTGLLGTSIEEQLKGKADVIGASFNHPENSFDLSKHNSLKSLFEKVGKVDAIICTVGMVEFDSWENEDDSKWNFGIANKMMGQINTIRFGQKYVNEGGFIILTTGILAHYPMKGSCITTTVNVAVEVAIKSVAFDMKHIRFNAVSPGWICETLEKYGMDTSLGLPASTIAEYYTKLVENSVSGEIVTVAKDI